MPKTYNWIDTYGGPHLLLPEELFPLWRGIEGWHDHNDPSDTSDYARACRVTSWLGIVPCSTGKALVLSGDVGPIAWIGDNHQDGGVLVQRLAASDEEGVSLAIDGEEMTRAFEAENVEELRFSTGPSGILRLFDAANSGTRLQNNSESLRLRPGSYRVRAGYLNAESLIAIVRQMDRWEPPFGR